MNEMKPYYFANQTCNREEARAVQKKIMKHTGLQLDNPFYGRDGDSPTREIAQLDATGSSTVSGYEITSIDLNKVRASAGVVAFLNVDKMALGTSWEICECITQWGKPAYVITSLPSLLKHPFLVDHHVPTFASSYDFIQYVNTNRDFFADSLASIKSDKKWWEIWTL